MSAPDRGFALMKLPQSLAKAYEASPLVRKNRGKFNELRKSFPQARPANYRGIGRNPINADYDHVEPGWQWANGELPIGEERARLALAEALGITGDGLPDEE